MHLSNSGTRAYTPEQDSEAVMFDVFGVFQGERGPAGASTVGPRGIPGIPGERGELVGVAKRIMSFC